MDLLLSQDRFSPFNRWTCFSRLAVVALEEKSCPGCLAALGAGVVTSVGRSSCEEPLLSCVQVASEVGTGRAGWRSAGISAFFCFLRSEYDESAQRVSVKIDERLRFDFGGLGIGLVAGLRRTNCYSELLL